MAVDCNKIKKIENNIEKWKKFLFITNAYYPLGDMSTPTPNPVEKRRNSLETLIDGMSTTCSTKNYGDAILAAFDAFSKAWDEGKCDYGRFLHSLDLLYESTSCMIQSETMCNSKDDS